MKFFFALGLLPFWLPAAFAHDSALIEKSVTLLGEWVYDVNVHAASGSTSEGLLSDLAAREMKGRKHSVIQDPEGVYLPLIDESGRTYGIVNPGPASRAFMDFSFRYGVPAESQRRRIHQTFTTLAHAGAVFGYGPIGSDVCGVRYPSLFVLDVPAATVYEFVFVGDEC